MDDTIFEQLATLNPTEFADALKTKAQPLFQAVFNQGHSAATAAARQKTDTLAAEIETLKTGRTGLEAELDELRKKQPNLEKWTQEKEAALLRQSETHKAEVEHLRQAIRDRVSGNERLRLQNALINAGLSEYLATRAIDEGVLKRIGVQLGSDGTPTVKHYMPDGETPLSLADGVNPYDVIATDVIAAMPEALRPRPGQRGSKLSQAGPSGGQQMTRAQFDGLGPAARMEHIRSGGAVVD